MKLRIKGNSIRLRVSRSDLANLAECGAIQDEVHFSGRPRDAWIYSIVRSQALSVPTVEFEERQVRVVIGNEDVRRWLSTEEVGIYFSLGIGVNGMLEVALEKDFACLDRSDEENSDTFPNPLTSEHCGVTTES
jgi:hypothetical protein